MLQTEAAMPTIYISDRGDDKNDGLSLKTPIYSLKQAQAGRQERLQPALRPARQGNAKNRTSLLVASIR